MGFKIEAEVEEGLPQYAVEAQQKGYEKPSYPSVPVEKGMYCLELGMGKRCLDEEGGSLRLIMEEEFEGGHRIGHSIGRGRHEDSVPRHSPSYPVLGTPEFSRRPFTAPSFLKQDSVDFLYQSVRQGKALFAAGEAMLESSNVVRDLYHIIQRNAGSLLELEKQEVRQGRLGALYLGRQHGLLAYIHVEEETGVGEEGCGAIEATEGQERAIEGIPHGVIDDQGRCRGKRAGHECPDRLVPDSGDEHIISC
jgi:hypothetical protein